MKLTGIISLLPFYQCFFFFPNNIEEQFTENPLGDSISIIINSSSHKINDTS